MHVPFVFYRSCSSYCWKIAIIIIFVFTSFLCIYLAIVTLRVGRAGRDGQPATCILLLNQDDAVRSLSLSHSGRLSRAQVKSLLLRIFPLTALTAAGAATAAASSTARIAVRVALSTEDTEGDLDVSGEKWLDLHHETLLPIRNKSFAA